MTTSPIAQVGAVILRSQAQAVENLADPKITQLIDCLITTAIANKGVGIAAPQIHQPYRIFVITSHPSDRYPHAPTMPPTAMINPRLLSQGSKIVKDWEGCLSVPNIRGLVPRYQEIEVEYTSSSGIVHQTILTGFVARIFQHELDHLDGIIFTDRLIDSQDLFTEAEYRQVVKNQHKK